MAASLLRTRERYPSTSRSQRPSVPHPSPMLSCFCQAHTRAHKHMQHAHTHAHIPTHDWPCGADWLIERRVLSKGSYQKALRTVHAKIAAALAEERPDCPGIAEVLPPGIEQEKVSYVTCCRVLELLKEGGLLAEKTFLGSYTNPHAARWADIVKRYEAGRIFLVDMAQGLRVASPTPILIRAVKRCVKLRASPEAAVAMDQTAIPTATIFTRFLRSASHIS